MPFTITVVDAGGFLVAAQRMDGAALAAIGTSASKATMALLLAQPTRDLVDAGTAGRSAVRRPVGYQDAAGPRARRGASH